MKTKKSGGVRRVKPHSFVCVRSGFGEIWIGKVTLPPDDKKIFSDIKKAIERAANFFCERHYEDMGEIEGGTSENIELCDEYESINNATADNVDDATKLTEFFA